MKTDLVLDPFGALLPDIVTAARVAEESGFDGVWTFDHFSGSVAARPWSRDPFVILGAVAASTSRVDLGLLVANMWNRHPVQLASAISSLQSLAPGRVVCGVGSGADPASRFAIEHHAIGTVIPDAAARRARLVETIQTLGIIWEHGVVPADRAGASFRGDHLLLHGLAGVVGPEPRPPIIVGASGAATIRLAAEHADGVNIRRTPHLAARLAALRNADLRTMPADRPFEISVFDSFDPDHPIGGAVDDLEGVHRRTLVVSPPYPFDAIARIGPRLHGA